jgi:hypothetical protein
MIRVFADDELAFDSRLEDYDLLGLKITTSLNRGGTAEITMPTGHPAYNLFTSYKTIVTIYRRLASGYDALVFRGRVLYLEEDINNSRTVVCEGALCFFQDTISRPYLYQDTPANVFRKLIEVHNGQVEPAKQFTLGSVTVTDPNDYIRLESETAEPVLETINKLLTRCGGIISFGRTADKSKTIFWTDGPDRKNSQSITFGSNLLDFSRSGSNTNLATAILPYGAKDEETGLRITIADVNEGQDFLQDDEAVALRGFIIKTVTWDDVTDPNILLHKAREWLGTNRSIVTSLRVSALDLAHIDKSYSNFRVGDLVRVTSAPHGVDEDFQKNPANMIPIEAPYYVLRLPQICTDGYTGARINDKAQVISTEGNPIPGLYAAGSCADAQVTSVNYNGCGTSLLTCGVFGRAAAQDAVSKLVK